MTRHVIFASLTLLILTSLGLARGAEPIEGLDLYGGHKAIQREKTGFFRLERLHGRDFLITPEGHPYLALSVCHIDLRDAVSGVDVTNLLRSFGYTCAGYNVPAAVAERFPCLQEVNVLGPRKPQENTPQSQCRDVFDPAVVRQNEEIIQKACAIHRTNSFLVGYYLMDTPEWHVERARARGHTDYPAFIKQLGKSSPGKAAYLQFLKDTYSNDLAKLNAAYGTRFASFDEILAHPFVKPSQAGSREFADDLAFEGHIAERYYATCRALFRKHAPHHLVFGDKYKHDWKTASFADESVLRAASRHMDVISFEATFGPNFPAKDVEALHQITQRPIMIADHDVMSVEPGKPWEVFLTERARGITQYASSAFATDHIIGIGKCQYFDRPKETMLRGIVNPDHTPCLPYLEMIRESNRAIQRRAFERAMGR